MALKGMSTIRGNFAKALSVCLSRSLWLSWFCFAEAGSHSTVQPKLALKILLPHTPGSWGSVCTTSPAPELGIYAEHFKLLVTRPIWNWV